MGGGVHPVAYIGMSMKTVQNPVHRSEHAAKNSCWAMSENAHGDLTPLIYANWTQAIIKAARSLYLNVKPYRSMEAVSKSQFDFGAELGAKSMNAIF